MPFNKLKMFLCICLSFYLLSLRTVTFYKVLAHFSFAGHVDMTVGTVTVVTDALQEVGTHRHLGRDRHVRVYHVNLTNVHSA